MNAAAMKLQNPRQAKNAVAATRVQEAERLRAIQLQEIGTRLERGAIAA
jgi:hypothetical protein